MKMLWIILAVILIAGVGFYFISGSKITGNAINSDNVRVINLKAERWEFTPGTITVKKGEHVKIMINNTDTTHGINIPDLGVSGIDSVEFTADKAGTFEFECPTMCGMGHREMKGTLIVE